MLRRKSLLKQNEIEDSTRRILLAKLKQHERLSHVKEVSPTEPASSLYCH